MKRSKVVTIGLTAVLAAAVAGCSEEEPQHSAICVDQETEQRVEDDVCAEGRDHSGFAFFYLPVGYSAPPVGGRITASQGSYVKPAGSTGSVPRSGGFGGSKSGSGSGGG